MLQLKLSGSSNFTSSSILLVKDLLKRRIFLNLYYLKISLHRQKIGTLLIFFILVTQIHVPSFPNLIYTICKMFEEIIASLSTICFSSQQSFWVSWHKGSFSIFCLKLCEFLQFIQSLQVWLSMFRKEQFGDFSSSLQLQLLSKMLTEYFGVKCDLQVISSDPPQFQSGRPGVHG